jgi:hypothetical protein
MLYSLAVVFYWHEGCRVSDGSSQPFCLCVGAVVAIGFAVARTAKCIDAKSMTIKTTSVAAVV